MHKYSHIFQISWDNGFVYRLNFIMWRLRVVLQMLAVLFLWSAVLKNSTNAFGYTDTEMLTYIFGISLLRSVIFMGRTTDVQAEISSGDLNNMLIKPIGYFSYWFSRDMADKILNVIFAVVEISILIWLLKPSLLPPASAEAAALFLIAVLIAIFLYFFLSFCISMTTFWMPESNGWSQRFFALIILEFFAGGLFPLDILPVPMQSLVAKLPTTYLMFTPMQIYLGRFNTHESLVAISMAAMWTLAFFSIARFTFNKGIKIYGAYGR